MQIVLRSPCQSWHRPLFSPSALFLVIALFLAACGDDDSSPSGPEGSDFEGELLINLNFPDESGQSGSSFLVTADLDQEKITSTDGLEETFFAYSHVRGDEVLVTQHIAGDLLNRYERGADGRLVQAGQLSLSPGSFGANVAWASATKAYVSLMWAGKIVIFNPQTMTQLGEIDLTQGGYAVNPNNPDDVNPEPSVMIIRNGKLFVGLQQLVTGFASADGAYALVIDTATDQIEKMISDPRTASPGRYGNNQTMFIDEAGDIYMYAVASFGFAPGQKPGFLRILRGQTEFDPDYFFDVSSESADVEGGTVRTLNGMVYGGDGYVYGIIEVPALYSNPPVYAFDLAWQPVRLHLADQRLELLPLPLANGGSAGVCRFGDRILFGMTTADDTGIFSYNPATGQATTEPIVRTDGTPAVILPFQ